MIIQKNPVMNKMMKRKLGIMLAFAGLFLCGSFSHGATVTPFSESFETDGNEGTGDGRYLVENGSDALGSD